MLSRLASTALPRTKPEDFMLIKESKNYRNVYCKIYMNSVEKPKCLNSELIDGKHRVKSLEIRYLKSLRALVLCK